MSPIVLKVGGSLFDLPDLADRLNQQLQQFADQPRLLIAGGGVAADVVRDWDRLHSLSPQVSHVLAVHSMSLTARFLATLLPQAQLVTSINQATAAWSGHPRAILILDVAHDVLAAEEAHLLPASWDVTSDAIATWVAIQINACRIAFLKSVDRPDGANWQEISTQGHLDPYTPGLLAHTSNLHVDWINLRSSLSFTSTPGDPGPIAAGIPLHGTQSSTRS